MSFAMRYMAVFFVVFVNSPHLLVSHHRHCGEASLVFAVAAIGTVSYFLLRSFFFPPTFLYIFIRVHTFGSNSEVRQQFLEHVLCRTSFSSFFFF